MNQAITRPIILGHLEVEVIELVRELFNSLRNLGRCSHTWQNQGSIIVATLYRWHSINRMQLRSGVACELNAIRCIDIESEDTFWDPVSADSCKLSDYSYIKDMEIKYLTTWINYFKQHTHDTRNNICINKHEKTYNLWIHSFGASKTNNFRNYFWSNNF